MQVDRLAQLLDDAASAVAAGHNDVELPTRSGSPRWGLSANLRPDAEGTAHLDALTAEVLDVLGEHHWPTGASASSHLTLRPLEPHRGSVSTTDPALGRYGAALRRAVLRTPPVGFDLGRVGLAPNCVLIEARPVDDTCAQLHRRFDEELGDDGWFQHGVVRDLWYASLVHFARPVSRGRDLVRWIEARGGEQVASTSCDRVQVIQWELVDGRVDPTVLLEVPLEDQDGPTRPDRG